MKTLSNQHHFDSPLIDLHCDVLGRIRKGTSIINGRRTGHCDLPRLKKGGVSAIVFSLFTFPHFPIKSSYKKRIDKQLKLLQDAVEYSNGEISIAFDREDLEKNFEDGVISIIIEMEGLHPIGNDIKLLEYYYERGVRIFTLTWNNSNAFATSCQEALKKSSGTGLTGLGREAVSEINRLGALIDLSHASSRTFYDVFKLSSSPPIASHSCLKHFKNSSRNITDEQLVMLAEAGGIIGINFYTNFLSSKSRSKVTINTIVDQMLYIKEKVGTDVIAFGSDFDGVSSLPRGIDDVSDFPKIIDALLDSGFSQEEVEKICWHNFMRVFGEL